MHILTCMKVCSKCKTEKYEDDFHWRSREKQVRQSCCKTCKSGVDKASNSVDPARFQARKHKAQNELRQRNRALLLDYLQGKKCADCPEFDPVVLDFDHQHGKIANVSKLLTNSSWQRILKEIEKCEIRCANCHRRRTAKQFGWYKLQGMD